MKRIIALVTVFLLLIPALAGATSPPEMSDFLGISDPRLRKAMEAMAHMESGGADMRLDIGVDMGGMSMNMTANVAADYTPAASHVLFAMNLFGQSMEMEAYIMQEDGEEAMYYRETTPYMDGDDSPAIWRRFADFSDAPLFARNSRDEFTDMVDFSPLQVDAAASSATETVFTGDLLSSQWNRNMLRLTVMIAEAFALSEPSFIPAIDAFADIKGGLIYTVKVSETTGLPTGLVVDISEFVTQGYHALAANWPDDANMPTGMDIRCLMDISLRDIGALSSIELPPEAEALRDAGVNDTPTDPFVGSIGVIGGTDGPTALWYTYAP